MYVNSVVVVGNLTGDPVEGGTDNKVANFRLAVNRWRKGSPEGEEDSRERTEFIDVECWGSMADHVCTSMRKGDRAIVVGQLKYDRWSDEAGNPRSKVRIRASAVGPSLEFTSVQL